jgi:signal transduction histidine kinase
MVESGAFRRWDLWLTVTGLGVALALVLLAATADRAYEDRHALVLDGHFLALAHRVEAELRDGGPRVARDVLTRAVAEEKPGLVVALALVGARGVDVEVEESSSAGPVETREVDLYLGRKWRDATPSPGIEGHPGRRILRITTDPTVATQPLSERLLLPSTAATGLVVMALALLGGRLLMRRERVERSRAERRRMEGLARAGAGLAHQLRTPLATIKGSCQLLIESCEEAGEGRLQVVLEQAERMERLLGKLLDYARPPRAEPAAVELGAAAGEVAAADPRVSVSVAPGLVTRFDPEHLRQILENLVENALAASPDGSPVDIQAHPRGGRIEVTVGDRGAGPGPDPETFFEPYLTRRPDGTGLGLPIARALAEAGGGRLELAPRPGGGTLAVLTLPRVEGAS